MKCSKCGYVGFETGDRCRNCGYDFSLAVAVEPDLPLRLDETAAAPFSDFSLGELGGPDPDQAGALDLDRLIGTPSSSAPSPPPIVEPDAEGRLPLFDVDDGPLIQSAGPPRAPLAVRRATPEVPRARSRTTRPLRREEPPLALDLEPPPAEPRAPAHRPVYVRHGAGAIEPDAAGGVSRLTAFLLDLALLAAINAGVVYLTLQIAGLSPDDADVLPLGPLVAFLALLNGGYLVALTAASGQTIGKMAVGVRVVAEGGGRLDTGRAVLRAAASVLSMATLGAGFVPALLRPGGRTFHDRIAGTRVVRD
jgi:uncharacterized RDD family membrane protein YckC